MALQETSGEFAARVGAIVDAHASLEGPLLPILHAIQAEFGHLPREALPQVAERLNLSRAEVHGVASFYHDFTEEPRGRHVLRLCRAEACQSMGSEELAERMQHQLRLRPGQTSPDGSVTLESVYCLGLCACAPAAMFDGRLVGRLTSARLDALIAEVKA